MHASTLLAGTDGGTSNSGGAVIQLGILLLIPLAMYFLLIRPQRRRMREQQAMQSALEVGDEVMTASGVYGFITGFDDDKVWVEVDDDVQLRINRNFIQGRVANPTETAGGVSGSRQLGRPRSDAGPTTDAEGSSDAASRDE